MVILPNNGKGSVQKIWDAIMDPENGMLVKLTRIEWRTGNLEKVISEFKEEHERLDSRISGLEMTRARTEGGAAVIRILIGLLAGAAGGVLSLVAAMIFGG